MKTKSKILVLSLISSILVLTNFSVVGDKNIESTEMEYDYYSYQEMVDLFETLQNTYPDIFSYTSLGKTYENRDVWMIKISDNVETNEDEPGVLLMGSMHGDERPPFESLIFFIEHVVDFYYKENTDDDDDGQLNEDPIDGVDNDNDGQIDEDPSEDRVRDAVNNTEIFVIPMLNPDGVEYESGQQIGWRKNRNPKAGQTHSIGVDLNRNFGFKWELYDIFPDIYNNDWTSDPDSWNYRGEKPFSESETTALKNFVEGEDIKISLSYHSYSEIILYPWSHTSQRTPHENKFRSIANSMARINGYYVYHGQSTFLPWPGGTIGTSENWFYGEQGILSFTMELCKSKRPTNPDVVYDCCYNHVGVNLFVCEQSPSVNVENVVERSFMFPLIHRFLQNIL